jgi:hypothetical protein
MRTVGIVAASNRWLGGVVAERDDQPMSRLFAFLVPPDLGLAISIAHRRAEI